MLADTGHPQRIHSRAQRNPIVAVWDLLGEVQHFHRRELREVALTYGPATTIEVIRGITRIHPVILPPAVVQDVHDAQRRHGCLPNLCWSNLPSPQSTEKANASSHSRRIVAWTTRKALAKRVDTLAGTSWEDCRTGV